MTKRAKSDGLPSRLRKNERFSVDYIVGWWASVV
jgi:hypothetical protein